MLNGRLGISGVELLGCTATLLVNSYLVFVGTPTGNLTKMT
jgi:hypothetical protein